MAPRSVSSTRRLPVAKTLSTTGPMSQGAMNWPFLILTALPVWAAATSRSVWRQRKAGICKTSKTCGGGLHVRHLMDVRDHRQAHFVFHPGQDFQARAQAGAPEEVREVRLALSKEALKMRGRLSSAA